MILKTEHAVPHKVYFDAKQYVEKSRIRFFDFFRNSAFGFVRVGEKTGHYTHLVIRDDGRLDGYCSCKEADPDEVCSHAFSLYLKLLNWPFEKLNLSDAFEKDHFSNFIKTVGRSLYNKPINRSTNPALVLPDGLVPPRFGQYWGFREIEGSTATTRRDLEMLEKAIKLTRTSSETQMLRKGFPPARVLFEESRFYNVCKLLFLLRLKADLRIRVKLAPEHQVRLVAEHKGHEIFTWQMPVDGFLKGVNQDWDFWEELSDFPIRRQAVPLTYRIGFTATNQLELEPMVEVAPAHHVALDQVILPSSKNLYYHELAGYFRIQTGLSPFEMEFSTPQIHTIDHAQVKGFLKDHAEVLKTLDRTLIDEALFGEVVVEHFQNFTLTLVDFKDDHFGYTLTAKLGDKVFDDAELRGLFQSTGRYRQLAGKLFDATGYDGVYLKPLFEGTEQSPRLSVSEFLRLLCFFRDRLDVSTTPLSEQVFLQIRDYKAPAPPSLEFTRLSLRAYQQAGYEWLYFLKTFGLGGLLCDQMGLGKTHQGMALLAATLLQRPEGKVLVVAPASVIFHWRDKLANFCPSLKVCLHYGSDRKIEKALQHQVVISTYHTLRNDAEQLSEQVFDLIIFDEIQTLKNKSTKAYRSLIRLQALCKIGLTGTPVENSVSELKALIDIVFPGLLGSDSNFKRYFLSPIMDFNNETMKAQLKQMVNPFTLRRNKSEVLTELPEKIEDLRTVEMTDYEMELYKEVKAQGKRHIEGLSDGGGMLHILTIITQLKQVCDHPALYFKNTDYDSYPCAKWEMFVELFEETMASGEKLVVFTQYLGMIDIFKAFLQKQGIEFACITGGTRNRADEQDRFQTDPNCRVFLGTVGAAGTGIDLIAASVLIHYDRWWNAAREEQATDRIHRIGQKSVVQIYKFRTLDTVEERIDAIIERKRLLMEDLVGFDDEGMAKVFNIDDLLEILA